MRPTRRGLAVLLVAAAAFVMGTRYGQAGLNAVAGPAVVLFLAATVQVLWSGPPTIDRDKPRRGYPGDERTVAFDADGNGLARLADEVPDGVDGDGRVTRSLPTTVRYDVTYTDRGPKQFGPVEAVVTDPLGLVRRQYTVDATTETLVYPPVYRIGGPKTFSRTLAPDAEDRQAFDRLREYVPSDSLRDVHWKSSAKRDEMLVKEFADHHSDQGLLVVGEADEGVADEMAAATATVAMAALEAGLTVELTVPGGTVSKGYGDTHRTRLLETLARTGAGETGRADAADILVTARETGVTVTIEGRRHRFGDVTTSRENPLAGGEA
ncbi:DUF58 domain-containing protein [Haloarcula halophila]|uniref:DUF58 domain-containing protein n=1 Tax=Haloarcula TaxID=2237 RepID=UPI0023E397C1|nr:DUF58 domain-containing protein [Halomicroarcula sp. DFY41]